MMRRSSVSLVALQLLIVFAAINLKSNVSAYSPVVRSVTPNPREAHIDQPIIKSHKRPLLVVIDPITKSRIHLVGVSHGSASSAVLVKEVISEISKPAAVVLELCDDRFWSISLDAKIRPRGNETLAKAYDIKIANYEIKKKASQKTAGLVGFFSQMVNTFRFISGQGLIGGTFVLLGLFVSDLQRMTRSNTGGDEFVTAMIEAERLNIPIRLGDAPQNDTLNSIKRVMSKEVFVPSQVVQGASLLAFSALGLLPAESNLALSSRIPKNIMKASEWVNIPAAYMDNSSMLKSLLPLFVAVFLTTSIGFLPFLNGDNIELDAAAAAMGAASTLPPLPYTLPELMSKLSQISLFDPSAFSSDALQDSLASIGSLLGGGMPPEVEMVVTTVIDFMSILVLIRMAKIIGTDRDCIIAKNIQLAAAEFPGRDIVVVIGMLHCNGVARWLLSGTDPMTFDSTPELQKASGSKQNRGVAARRTTH